MFSRAEKDRYRVVAAISVDKTFVSPEDGGEVEEGIPKAYELARPDTQDEALEVIEEAKKLYDGALIHYARDTKTGEIFGVSRQETENELLHVTYLSRVVAAA